MESVINGRFPKVFGKNREKKRRKVSVLNANVWNGRRVNREDSPSIFFSVYNNRIQGRPEEILVVRKKGEAVYEKKKKLIRKKK